MGDREDADLVATGLVQQELPDASLVVASRLALISLATRWLGPLSRGRVRRPAIETDGILGGGERIAGGRQGSKPEQLP